MASSMSESLRVAAVQAAPEFLDGDATIEKACRLIQEAGKAGARLVVFPESFIPTYPDWVWAARPGADMGALEVLYSAFLDNSVAVPSEATQRLGQAAKQAGAYVAIGISERNAEASGGSLYNTLLYLGPGGEIVGKHRKLVPTNAERLIWGQGDGSTLEVYQTDIGRIGGLICWENYMPLARYALYAWGAQIYLAPTWDRGEPWLSTIRHIAKEGRLWVISASIALHTKHLPTNVRGVDIRGQFYGEAEEWINGGDSAIVNPDGEFIAGPAHEVEEILYADLPLAEGPKHKWMLDVAGHYARPDVFELTINRAAHPVLRSEQNPTATAIGARSKGIRR